MLLDEVQTPGPPAAGRARRRRRTVLVVLLVALVGVTVATLESASTAPAPMPRVAITFPGDPDVVESDWGNEDVYGAAGSYVLAYEHDDRTTMVLPWSGGDVVGARLGDDEHNLLTVEGIAQDGGTLLVDVLVTNCRYFHERAIDIYTGITLTLDDGGTQVVPFDRPLLVKSPMLASCPDRTLDRGDDARGNTFRRGG